MYLKDFLQNEVKCNQLVHKHTSSPCATRTAPIHQEIDTRLLGVSCGVWQWDICTFGSHEFGGWASVD